MKKPKSSRSIVLFSLIPTFFLGAWGSFNSPEPSELAPHPEIRQEAKVKKVIPEERATKKNELDLFERLTSGVRSPEELDEEWTSWVGTSTGIRMSQLKTLPKHRLTMLLTEVKNLASNPYRVLFVHSFSRPTEEDAVTLYSRELDGLEEKNVDAKIIAAQEIGKAEGQSLQLERAYRYHFSLTHSYLKRAYDLRAPRGQSQTYPVDTSDYHLLEELVAAVTQNEAKAFESGTYRTELVIGGKSHDVQMTLRQTDIETFTIDLRVQEVGSLLIRRFGLIYE